MKSQNDSTSKKKQQVNTTSHHIELSKQGFSVEQPID